MHFTANWAGSNDSVGGRVYTTVVRHAGSTANMANGSPTSEGGAVRRLIDMCDSVSKDSILAR